MIGWVDDILSPDSWRQMLLEQSYYVVVVVVGSVLFVIYDIYLLLVWLQDAYPLRRFLFDF